MRNRFGEVIWKLSKSNKKICLVVADITPGGKINKFENKYPNRFINCGVSEQSMISISSGLAIAGLKPFCYSIATFALYRPFEFVRVDLCYQKLPVVVVGMGSGGIYNTLGATHQSIEDVSIASSIPNMQVLCPCDPNELEECLKWCVKYNNGPLYLKIGKTGEQNITTKKTEKFKFGKIRYLFKGTDYALISYGNISGMVKNIYDNLKKKKLSFSFINCHTLKPLDKNGIKKILKKYKKIFIIEENVAHGGLGSMVQKIAYTSDCRNKVVSFHLKDEFIHCYGSYKEFLKLHGLSENLLIKKILKEISKYEY